MNATYPAVIAFLDGHIIQQMVEMHGDYGPLETCWHIRALTDEFITYDLGLLLLFKGSFRR